MTKLRDMDNRSFTTHAHSKKLASSAEFMMGCKRKADGNPFYSGDEQLMNVPVAVD